MNRNAHYQFRPEAFTLDPESPLAGSLVLGLLGAGFGSTRAWDSSRYSAHAALANVDTTTCWMPEPRLGRQKMVLDGINDILNGVTHPRFNGTTGTCCYWMRKESTDDYNAFAYRPGLSNQLGISAHSYIVYDASTNPKTGNLGMPASSTFFHNALTWDNGTLLAYRNGSYVSTGAGVGTGIFDFNVTGTFTLGGTWYGAPYFCSWSDLLIFDRALAPVEVRCVADPSNVLLEIGGRPLILPRRRRFFPAAAPTGPKIAIFMHYYRQMRDG